MEQFKNKVLFIENKNMYDEVRNLILESGFKMDINFVLMNNDLDYLYLHPNKHKTFSMSFKSNIDQRITFEEFKTLLKK